jgi:hypothetical protein
VSWEADKLSEMLVIDNSANTAFNGSIWNSSATSYMYYLVRNSHLSPLVISPRQLRVMGGSTIDALNDSHMNVPLPLTSYQGPIMDFSFENCTLQASSGVPAWTWPQNPQIGTQTTMGFVLGIDCNWGTGGNANRLQFPSNTSQVGNNQFENMLVKVFPGMIVLADNGKTPTTANYGYIASISSPGDGSAAWLNIVWVYGTKPTSGTLWLHRWRRLNWVNVTLGTAGGVRTT